ncbi:MAG: hypothetical protein IKW03_06520 [Clostridia bacterium]|nr:hypothetical protein [Clostridia bacterium]
MDKNDLIPENNAPEEVKETAEEVNETPAEEAVPETMRRTTTSNVDFSAEDAITVVAAPEEKGNKLPIIIAACVVAVVVIVAALILFLNSGGDKNPAGVEGESQTEQVHVHGNNAFNDFLNEAMTEEITDISGGVVSRDEYIENIKNQVQEATTTLSENVGKDSPNEIVENTTTAQENNNNVQNVNADQKKKAEEQIKAFMNRACYIQGAMYTQGSGDPLAMSIDGDNFEILTNLDGTEVAIMKADDIMYIKRPATKQYVELTASLMDMMGLEGDTFNLSFASSDYETMQSNLRRIFSVTVNGKEGICHEYVNKEQIFRFYSVDGKLKQIDTCNLTGVADTKIMITYFSESIPSDQMTLKGYTKSSIGAIFADMM